MSCEDNVKECNHNEPEADLKGANTSGVIRELGELGAGAVISETALARLFGRHPVSIKRAVSRRELPAPFRLMGEPVWTVGALVQHLEKRQETAQKEAETMERKIAQLRP